MSIIKSGPFKPITKNFDIEQSLQLAKLAYRYPNLTEFKEAALAELPQATRKTRLELTGRFQNAFLEIDGSQIVQTPALKIWASSQVEAQVRRQLLYVYYLRTFPLAWHAVRELVLPHSGNGVVNADREIPQQDWDAFLSRQLVPCAESTFVRTRNHLTVHLTKFGMLQTESESGDRFNKRFLAYPTQPQAEIFWFALWLEYAENGWISRAFEYLSEGSWIRVAFCSPESYINWALAEAEQVDLGYSDYYGSEKQFAWRVADIPAVISERLTGEPV